MKYLRPIAVIQAVPVRTSRSYILQLLVPGLLLLATGCSQEKDAFLNRAYHRLTARDNGWFNANEKLKEVVVSIEDNYVDDYDKVLPLFVYGTEEQARNAIPELEKCIEKCSLVIERHKMEIKGEEKNKWIDDAYFVIAKSHFYKRNYTEAERGFAYISRKYKGENTQMRSFVWLARTAIQLEQFAKAQSALDDVKGQQKLPKKFDHGELSAVQAELDLKRGKIDDAIIHLEHAIDVTKNKRDRVRWSFVLAQLYQAKSQEAKAIEQFASVVKMNPPYEMGFHAQIFQALAFNRGDSKALRQKLNRMLKDEKHVDHYDMIHYALAELDLAERKKEEAIERLMVSAQVSTTDTRQKAKTFLKLADIHFEDRAYADAQMYYDSTRTLMVPEHERYDEVDTRADVLGDLVEQLAIIALEDSLQEWAQLDEGELEQRVQRLIRDREAAEAERERMEEEARERMENAPATNKPMSSEMIVLVLRFSGTSPSTIRCARPSTIAVFPTPGSPSRIGLFFVRRERIWSTRLISSSRPITGSILPCRARSFRFFEYRSSDLYFASAFWSVTDDPPLNSLMALTRPARSKPASFMTEAVLSLPARIASKRCSTATNSSLNSRSSFSACCSIVFVADER